MGCRSVFASRFGRCSVQSAGGSCDRPGCQRNSSSGRPVSTAVRQGRVRRLPPNSGRCGFFFRVALLRHSCHHGGHAGSNRLDSPKQGADWASGAVDQRWPVPARHSTPGLYDPAKSLGHATRCRRLSRWLQCAATGQFHAVQWPAILHAPAAQSSHRKPAQHAADGSADLQASDGARQPATPCPQLESGRNGTCATAIKDVATRVDVTSVIGAKSACEVRNSCFCRTARKPQERKRRRGAMT